MQWCDEIYTTSASSVLAHVFCLFPLIWLLSRNPSHCRFRCFHELLVRQTKAEIMWQVFTFITFLISRVKNECRPPFHPTFFFIIFLLQWTRCLPVSLIYTVAPSSDNVCICRQANKHYITWHSALSVISPSFSICDLLFSIKLKSTLESFEGN